MLLGKMKEKLMENSGFPLIWDTVRGPALCCRRMWGGRAALSCRGISGGRAHHVIAEEPASRIIAVCLLPSSCTQHLLLNALYAA